MKKFLLIPALLLVLTLVLSACTGTELPKETEGDTIPDTIPGTVDTVEDTQAPDTTEETQAPGTTEETKAPDESIVETTEETKAPETAEETKAPEKETKPVETKPVETKPAETEPPADPNQPTLIFTPEDLFTTTGHYDLDDGNGIVLSEDGSYITYTPSGSDPYYSPFGSSPYLDGDRYIVVKYRTNNAPNATMQIYIGDGALDNDNDMVRSEIITDGEWHLAIFDAMKVNEQLVDEITLQEGSAGSYDGSTVAFFRFDMLDMNYILDETGHAYQVTNESGQKIWAREPMGEGAYIDVAYVAFFSTEEGAMVYEYGEIEEPLEPEYVVTPEFLAEQAAKTGEISYVQMATGELKDGFITLTSTAGGDPYVTAINMGTTDGPTAKFLSIKYRTTVDASGQVFIGSGAGWTGQGDNPTFKYIPDGEWHLAIIDLNTAVTSLDGAATYLRYDFFMGGENQSIDVAYIAFFNSEDDANTYEYGEPSKPTLVIGDETIELDLIENWDSVYGEPFMGWGTIASDGNGNVKINCDGTNILCVYGINGGLMNAESAAITGFEHIVFSIDTTNSTADLQFIFQPEKEAGTNFTTGPVGSAYLIKEDGTLVEIAPNSYNRWGYNIPKGTKGTLILPYTTISNYDNGETADVNENDIPAFASAADASITRLGFMIVPQDGQAGGDMIIGDVYTCGAIAALAPYEHGYVEDGLVSMYKGGEGTTWVDLIGDHDVTLNTNEKNYLDAEGLHLDSARQYFPDAIAALLNGDEFTIEVTLKDFVSLTEGADSRWDGIISATNDAFSLYINGGNTLTVKTVAANGTNNSAGRPTSADGAAAILSKAEVFVTVTYTKSTGVVMVYINGGAFTAEGLCEAGQALNVDQLFIGGVDDYSLNRRESSAVYKSVRFYNRALTAEEVAANYAVDVPPAPAEDLTIDLTALSNKNGYAATWDAAGYTVPHYKLGYGGVIELGAIDLSKYSAVKISYGCDGSQVTADNFAAASSLAIGLKSEASSYGQATDDNFTGDIAHTDMEFVAVGWAGGQREAVVDLTGVDYNGNVWVTVHNPAGTEIVIDGIVFVA